MADNQDLATKLREEAKDIHSFIQRTMLRGQSLRIFITNPESAFKDLSETDRNSLVCQYYCMEGAISSLRGYISAVYDRCNRNGINLEDILVPPQPENIPPQNEPLETQECTLQD